MVDHAGRASKSYRIAVQRFAADAAERRSARVDELPRKAIQRARVLGRVHDDRRQRVPRAGPRRPARRGARARLPELAQIGADALLEGEIDARRATASASRSASGTRRSAGGSCAAATSRAPANRDATARRLADDVVEAFIGVRGVSSTEIAFVSDRSGNKEIFVMNADGSEPARAPPRTARSTTSRTGRPTATRSSTPRTAI